MAARSVTDAIARMGKARRFAGLAMVLVLTAATVMVIGGGVSGLHVSLGLIAGLLVLACIGVCVFTALYDEWTWREVQRELERLRRERAGPS